MTSLFNLELNKCESIVKAAVNKLLSSRTLSSFQTEREDLYQIGWMALMNCDKTYNPQGAAKFETYANTAIVNAVNKELKKLHDKRLHTANLDAVIEETASGDIDKFITTLVKTVESSRQFSQRERKIIWMKLSDNRTFTYIGKTMGFSRQRARQIFTKSLDKIKELMADEF